MLAYVVSVIVDGFSEFSECANCRGITYVSVSFPMYKHIHLYFAILVTIEEKIK